MREQEEEDDDDEFKKDEYECYKGIGSSRCDYSVFRHTKGNFAAKVTSFGLFMGHHQTSVYVVCLKSIGP